MSLIRETPGVHAAPNIQNHPDVYEVENRAADPDGRVEAAMWEIAPWTDRLLVDIGAGTGFHLERFHHAARHVVGVEPHAPSRLAMMARVSRLRLERASVMDGSAERLLLPDQAVDVAHARFAYFFGPGCEAGLRELERVMRPGGTAFIVANDLRTGTFAGWLRRSEWARGPGADAVEAFWREQGFSLTRLPSAWRFQDRADLEAVLHIEFPPALAAAIVREHAGLSVDYHLCLYHRRY